MAKAFIDDSTLTNIADAIRDVNGSSNTYLPGAMPDAIKDLAPNLTILTGVVPTEEEQTIDGEELGFDGFSSITINGIPSTYIGSSVTKKAAASYTPTKETQTISSGQYLTGAQTINPIPDEYIIPNLQPVEVQSTDYVTKTVMPDGCDGFSKVTVKGIPEEYIVPTGILSDSLITRASSTNTHSATIPSGYYVESNVTISEWKTGQITGSGTAGGTFNIPYSLIGFMPKWAVLIANSGYLKAAYNVLTYISTSSASVAWYFGSSTSTINFKSSGDGLPFATFNSSGVTFPAISSSTKYGANSYRWYALR